MRLPVLNIKGIKNENVPMDKVMSMLIYAMLQLPPELAQDLLVSMTEMYEQLRLHEDLERIKSVDLTWKLGDER